MAKSPKKVGPWTIGANYFIRTVTHHLTGKLIEIHAPFLVLVDAAWIADDGRFTQAIKDGAFSEVEPYPDGTEVIVNAESIIDACIINFALPRNQK